MNTSDKGFDLIKKFEGLKLSAYVCPAGVTTIGYGTTRYPDGKPVKTGDKTSVTLADAYLQYAVAEIEPQIEKLVKVPLQQYQFDALVSFVYNLGIGNLQKSTLLKLINKGDFHGALAEFPKWNKANGRPMEGLTRRREAEQELFSGLT